MACDSTVWHDVSMACDSTVWHDVTMTEQYGTRLAWHVTAQYGWM